MLCVTLDGSFFWMFTFDTNLSIDGSFLDVGCYDLSVTKAKPPRILQMGFCGGCYYCVGPVLHGFKLWGKGREGEV